MPPVLIALRLFMSSVAGFSHVRRGRRVIDEDEDAVAARESPPPECTRRSSPAAPCDPGPAGSWAVHSTVRGLTLTDAVLHRAFPRRRCSTPLTRQAEERLRSCWPGGRIRSPTVRPAVLDRRPTADDCRQTRAACGPSWSCLEHAATRRMRRGRPPWAALSERGPATFDDRVRRRPRAIARAPQQCRDSDGRHSCRPSLQSGCPRKLERLDLDLRIIRTAGQRNRLQRTDAHLTIDQRASDADPLPHMTGEVDALHRIAHFDRGGTLLEEP